MNRLADRIAIVSGAAQGIGAAMSQAMAAEGAYVLVTDINGDGANDVAKAIRDAGGRADSARVDIGDHDEIRRAVAIVAEKFGRIDILCNNAAYIGEWHDITHATDEEWDGCLRATLMGTQESTKAVLPFMIPHKRGSIIITSSIMGLVACPGAISYSTVKAGLIGYARCAALDYGPHNIRVNVIAPGPIKVHYSPEPGTPGYDYQVTRTFLNRQGEPREVAAAAVFLASDESSYVTGAVIPVDGGWTAM